MAERRSSKPSAGVRFSLPLFLLTSTLAPHRYLSFYRRMLLLSRKKRNFFFNKTHRRSLYFFFKSRRIISSTFFYFFYFFSRYEKLVYFFSNVFSSKPVDYWPITISNLNLTLNFFIGLVFTISRRLFSFLYKHYHAIPNFPLNLNSYFFTLLSFLFFSSEFQNRLHLNNPELMGRQTLSTFYKKPLRPFNLYLKPFFIYFNYLIAKYLALLARAPVALCIVNKPTALLSLNDIIFFLYFFKVCKISQFNLRSIFKPHDFFGLVFFSFRWFDFTWLLRRLQVILNLMSIFRHKHFWNYFFSLLKRYIYTYFQGWHLTGIYVSLRGKIGVVGNSRKRRLFWQIGKSSPSQFKKIIQYKDTFFYTSTGAIGFRIWVIR